MSLLKKKISELTAEERAKLTKEIGVPGRPFPMVGMREEESADGERVMSRYLGLLEDADNPVPILSERAYAEMMGQLMRDMPTPGMLDIFYEALRRRRIDNNRKVQFIKGEPGAGKSYMGKMIAQLRSKEGAYYVDCGGKNLNDILFETVLDFSSNKRFYEELDRILANGSIHEGSVKALKQGLGEAFVQDADGKCRILWDKIGDAPADKDDKSDRDRRMRIAKQTLEWVAKQEGISLGNDNALGMTTQKGPLIRAWEEGREIVLDEYNKSKEGSDDQLANVLQFLIGEVDECTVESKLKDKNDAATQNFVFHREDTRAGFFVTMTGNNEEDGTTTRSLNRSVNSRLRPRQLPLATVEDWQHRMCQVLTGVPISTLYKSAEAQWKKDPQAFGRMLWQWRTLGLSKQQIQNIPPHQKAMIENWPNVLSATHRLSKFFHGWSQLTNPDSALLQNPNMGAVAMEVDDEYHNEVSVDFRLLTEMIPGALDIIAEITPTMESRGFDIGNWSKAPERKTEDAFHEEPTLRYGSRLVEMIMNRIDQTAGSIGKDNLQKALEELAAKCGLKEADLKEGVATKRHMVADLLNVNPYKDQRPTVQAQMMQKLIAQHLRARFPDIQAEDERIVGLARISKELERFKTVESVKNPRENIFFIINESKSELKRKPLLESSSLDAMPGPDEETKLRTIANDVLIEERQLLNTLAMPVVGQHNMRALFTSSFYDSDRFSKPDDEFADESLAMAQGQSVTGLAITTVMTKRVNSAGKVEAAPVHVLRDLKRERTMVVGGPIDRRQALDFRYAGITYVDRTDPNAMIRAQSALNGLLRGHDAESERALRDAFLLRNRPPEERRDLENLDNEALAMLLVDDTVESHVPHYLPAPGYKPPSSTSRKPAQSRLRKSWELTR